MSPSLQELADRLGIRLPGSSKPKRPHRKRKAARVRAAEHRYKGPTCRKGHEYGPHKKRTTSRSGKVYLSRYCRQCANEAEARRREKLNAT